MEPARGSGLPSEGEGRYQQPEAPRIPSVSPSLGEFSLSSKLPAFP